MHRSRTAWTLAIAAIAAILVAWRLAAPPPADDPVPPHESAAGPRPASPAARSTPDTPAPERGPPPRRPRAESSDESRPGRIPRAFEPDRGTPPPAPGVVVVPDPPPGWTPASAHAVADAWGCAATPLLFQGPGDTARALTPPAGSADSTGEAGLLIRVVDDLGDGVPGAVLRIDGPGVEPERNGTFTAGAEGLVPLRFATSGRYDASVESAPEGWLGRPAGFERESWHGPSATIRFDATARERVVELRLAIARAARLEVEVPGASSVRPRVTDAPLASVGVRRDDGSLMQEWGGTWDGDLVTWTRLPAGSVYVFVNVDEAGSAGAWCRLEAGRTTRARLDLATDGTSLTVRVPSGSGSGTYVVASLFQLLDSVRPQVRRIRSLVPLGEGDETVVEFRNLAAGRYFVGAGFREGRSFAPALLDLRRGDNELRFPPPAADVETVDVPLVWAQRADHGWVWGIRPSLSFFAPAADPGPRFATLVPGGSNDPVVHAPRGSHDVLALHPPGSWYAGGANHRFLRIDVPGTKTLEPDRR